MITLDLKLYGWMFVAAFALSVREVFDGWLSQLISVLLVVAAVQGAYGTGAKRQRETPGKVHP